MSNTRGQYYECTVCGKYKKESYMAYIKPEMERDVFDSIDDICTNCVTEELRKLTDRMGVAKIYQTDTKWLIKNIFEKYPNHIYVEKVLFLAYILRDA